MLVMLMTLMMLMATMPRGDPRCIYMLHDHTCMYILLAKNAPKGGTEGLWTVKPATGNILPPRAELQLAETSFRDMPNVGSQTIRPTRTMPIAWANKTQFRWWQITVCHPVLPLPQFFMLRHEILPGTCNEVSCYSMLWFFLLHSHPCFMLRCAIFTSTFNYFFALWTIFCTCNHVVRFAVRPSLVLATMFNIMFSPPSCSDLVQKHVPTNRNSSVEIHRCFQWEELCQANGLQNQT